jgi:Adenylate and Guanylate cyclase catalytic domain
VTNGNFPAFNSTTQHKVVSALVAAAIFACLGGITTLATGRPLEIGLTNAILIGIAVGLFEEFYVQSQRGSWLRSMHPMRSISVYVVLILLIYFVTAHVVPNFRVGIHGGDVVVSEQGDTKRSIGIYGDAINIAARMEDAAAAHGVRCILSKTVAEALANRDRIHEIGEEAVRGISATVRVCEYRPRLDPIPIEHRTALTACTRRAGV